MAKQTPEQLYQMLLHKYSHIGCPAAHMEDNCAHPAECAENGRCRDLAPLSQNCDRCTAPTANPENDYGEFICDNCEQNSAEAAYERHCEDFYDGGATRFNSLEQQQAGARRLK